MGGHRLLLQQSTQGVSLGSFQKGKQQCCWLSLPFSFRQSAGMRTVSGLDALLTGPHGPSSHHFSL